MSRSITHQLYETTFPFLGSRLRDAIKLKGISQREAGRSAGLSPKIINEYVSGRRYPTIYNLYYLCEALDISADYLLGLSTESNDQYIKGMTDTLYSIVDYIEDKITKHEELEE